MKIPNFVYTLMGKIAGSKLNLKEDSKMEDSKKWYQSKSIWTSVVTALIGVYAIVQTTLAPTFGWKLPDIPEGILAFLGALGVYSRAVATKAIS